MNFIYYIFVIVDKRVLIGCILNVIFLYFDLYFYFIKVELFEICFDERLVD